MKSLWKTPVDIDLLNSSHPKTIHHSLGIRITQVGPDYLEGTMPVDPRTHQPMGLLHGGASAVLAESLGSIASILVAGLREKTCVGIELNLSHLRGVSQGEVTARATPIRLGQSIHVWEIKIWDSSDPERKTTCISRLTVLIKDLPALPNNSGSKPSPA
jgi:1,4-dihydroxy-2-naphthoyl-CoA hydrolase